MPARRRALPARHLLTIQESAEYYGVTVQTIRAYIAEGRLTALRLGPRMVRIDLAELDTLVQPIPTVGSGAA